MMRSVIIIILILVSFSEEKQIRKGSRKIVEGTDVDIKDYPYQIALQHFNSHVCGGSIISPDWILTAAHCIGRVSAEQYYVRVGSTYRHTGGDLHSVLKIVIHEKYSSETFDYDIALLQLKHSITAKNTQVIQLPPPGTGPDAGMTVVVTGWGRIAEGAPFSEALQMVKLSVVNHDDCKSVYTDMYSVTESMFCAGDRKGLRGACQGDSGGPAVIEGVQYGIVSWAEACASPDYPIVYANVAFLRNWIDKSSSTEEYSVRVGSTYRYTGGDLHSIARAVIHENYSSETVENDIGLLLLDRSITAKNTQIIQLPSPGTGPVGGTTIIVTGWGRIAEGGPSSDVLQMVKLSVVDHKECENDYSGINPITESMICAVDRKGLHGACIGDSGGPAVIDGIQYGIVSAGLSCASPQYPTIYANVAFLRNWIDESCAVST